MLLSGNLSRKTAWGLRNPAQKVDSGGFWWIDDLGAASDDDDCYWETARTSILKIA